MSHEKKRAITFFVTTNCNLACTYCVNDTANISNQKSISLNFAKRGLEDFFTERTDLFGINNNMIRFYAIGEPTTRMDIIKSITDYARKIKRDDLFVELQTNGFFSDKKAEWISENVNEVWISIDGEPAVQNKNRPSKKGKPTSRILEKNIKYLQGKNVFVGARPTITPENVDKQIEMLNYFKSIGIDWVYAEPMFESVKQNGSDCNNSISAVNLKKFVKEFVKAHKHAEKNGMNYGNFFTMNFDEHCNYACRSCLPMPHLTIDGYVSGCDLAYSGKTQLSDFIFGKYDEERNKINYFPEKISEIRTRQVNNIEECVTCDVKSNCGGGCAGLAYYATGNILGTVPEFCEATKYLAKHLPKNKGCAEHLHP